MENLIRSYSMKNPHLISSNCIDLQGKIIIIKIIIKVLNYRKYQSILHPSSNFAETFAESWNRDCNRIQTLNHLVLEWTLMHLAKLAKWLSCVVSTYLYDAFYCMLYHVTYGF